MDKRLAQLSFAYDVLDHAKVTLEDGTHANELRKVRVYEFSFVPVGANQDTSVIGVKHRHRHPDLLLRLRLAKAGPQPGQVV